MLISIISPLKVSILNTFCFLLTNLNFKNMLNLTQEKEELIKSADVREEFEKLKFQFDNIKNLLGLK